MRDQRRRPERNRFLCFTLTTAIAAVLGAANAADMASAATRSSAAGGSTARPFVPAAGTPPDTLEIATGHILIEIARGANVAAVERAAGPLGLHRRGDVHGSQWYTFALPHGANPRATARAASALPGIARATVDPIVTLLEHAVPHDPLYTPPISAAIRSSTFARISGGCSRSVPKRAGMNTRAPPRS